MAMAPRDTMTMTMATDVDVDDDDTASCAVVASGEVEEMRIYATRQPAGANKEGGGSRMDT